MDQIRIGELLKELRKEKGLTQEQLAEQFHVSRRTVSRWETGSSLPDLQMLVLLADYYGIGLRDLLDGERKNDDMNPDAEEAVLKAAEYGSEDKLRFTKLMHWLFIAGTIAGLLYLVLMFYEQGDTYIGGLCFGILLGSAIAGAAFTGKYGARFKKLQSKLTQKIKAGSRRQ